MRIEKAKLGEIREGRSYMRTEKARLGEVRDG